MPYIINRYNMAKLSLILGQKQSQGIVLTPQLLQSIKLFELNNLELEFYLANEVLENPFLENNESSLDEGIDLKEGLSNENDSRALEANLELEASQTENPMDDYTNIYDDIPLSSTNELTNVVEETIPYKKSIYENLTEQVDLNFSDYVDRSIGYTLIEHLDFDGYFRSNITEISHQLNIPEIRIKKILSILKSFEPIGIFSKNIEEYLFIQLKKMQLLNTPMKCLLENLSELLNGNIPVLSKICDVTDDDILIMLKQIRRCSQKPIDTFEEDHIRSGEPDIIVKKDSSNWIVELNENTLPRILINTGYWEELAKKNMTKEDKQYLAERYASGKWLLKATEQRAATILRVSAEIIKKQNDFLEKGLSYIKPMILKDIAKELDLHESTISRITNSKEISTPRGVFQLKFFFSKAISSIDGGEDISSQVVKNKIKKLIDNEGQIVLSDKKLVSLLKESGINVARRTVAKYRTNMKILPSFERKKSKFLYS